MVHKKLTLRVLNSPDWLLLVVVEDSDDVFRRACSFLSHIVHAVVGLGVTNATLRRLLGVIETGVVEAGKPAPYRPSLPRRPVPADAVLVVAAARPPVLGQTLQGQTVFPETKDSRLDALTGVYADVPDAGRGGLAMAVLQVVVHVGPLRLLFLVGAGRRPRLLATAPGDVVVLQGLFLGSLVAPETVPTTRPFRPPETVPRPRAAGLHAVEEKAVEVGGVATYAAVTARGAGETAPSTVPSRAATRAVPVTDVRPTGRPLGGNAVAATPPPP